MPEKRARESKLAKAIANAAVGTDIEKELDESFDDETKAKVSEYNEDFQESENEDDWKLDFETVPAATTLSQRSDLRTQNAPEVGSFAFDDRYKGIKVSRKSTENLMLKSNKEISSIDEQEQAAAELGYLLEGDSEEDSSNEADSNEDGEHSFSNEVNHEQASFNLGKEVDYGSFGGISEDEDTEDDQSNDEVENGSEEKSVGDEDGEPSITVTGKNDSNEYQKGLAIKSQMVVWDRLLEYRIQLQKILQCVNKFPQSDSWPNFMENLTFDQGTAYNGEAPKKDDIMKNCRSSIGNLLELLISTKSKLIENNIKSNVAISSNDENEEISNKPTPRKKRKLDEYESLLDSQHQKCIDFRNDTIERWNDRTRIAMGSSNSTKGKQASSFGSFELSTLKQIQHILSDTPRLVRRTQYKRTSYKVLGKVSEIDKNESDEDSNSTDDEANHSQNKRAHEEYDSEIFDDDDFYHNLLRELIERKSGSDEKQHDNWLQIQKLRAKSNRKKVDTRASKGRKIRFITTIRVLSMKMDVPGGNQNNMESTALSSILGDYASSSENEDENDLDDRKVENSDIKNTQNGLDHVETTITNDTKIDVKGPIDFAHPMNSDKNDCSDSFQMRQTKNIKNLAESYSVMPYNPSDSTSSSSEEEEESSSESDSSKDEKDLALDSDEEHDAPKTKEINNKQRNTIKVKGEILNSELPPIEDLHISVPEFECVPLGRISSIVDDLVVVKAHPNTAALDLDSVLFLDKGKRPLGKVFDVIGPVTSPFYCIRFNSIKHIKDKNITVESDVYCAPRTEHTSFVFVEQLRKMKGSDASWKDDVEPQNEQVDFSDDEEERAARRTRNKLFQKQTEELGCSSKNSSVHQDVEGRPGNIKQEQRKVLKAKRVYKPPSSNQQSNNAFYRNNKHYNPRHTGPVRWNSIPSRNNFRNSEPVPLQYNYMHSNGPTQPINLESVRYNQFPSQQMQPTIHRQMIPMEFSRPPPIRPTYDFSQQPIRYAGAPQMPTANFSVENTSNYMESQISSRFHQPIPSNPNGGSLASQHTFDCITKEENLLPPGT